MKSKLIKILICIIILTVAVTIFTTIHKINKNKAEERIKRKKSVTRDYYRKISSKKDKLTDKYEFKDNSDDDLIVLFLRAESTTADKFYINNHNIPNNTPELSKLKNIISFPNVYSLRNGTPIATSFMLTRFKEKNWKSIMKEQSVISVFKNINFETAYISYNDEIIGDELNPLRSIAVEAKYVFDKGDIDIDEKDLNIARSEDFITGYKFLKLFDAGAFDKKSFVVLSHCCGAHVPCDYYPNIEKFTKFKPFCNKKNDYYKCTDEELLNSYYNSISYTDHLVAEVIEKVKDRNAILIFSSDHGESIGDDGDYGHGYMADSTSKNQTNVATFVWVSDKYKKYNQQKYNNMVKNKDKYINHSVMFHSLLDCSNISSDAIEKNKSICSAKLHEMQEYRKRYNFKIIKKK